MKQLRALLLCTFLGMAEMAQATPVVIDFDANVFNNTSVDNLILNPYVEDGFEILTASRPLSIAGTLSTDWLGSPSAHLRIGSGAIDLGIAAVGGGLFNLLSIDVSILNPSGSSPLVIFNAFDALNTLVGTQSFQPTTFGLQTVVFGGVFLGVSRVEWHQGTGEYNAHQFDNIVVDAAVPEPASIVLLGLGLFGLGFSRRKKA